MSGERCSAGLSGQLGPGCHCLRAALMMSSRQSADGAAFRARGLGLPASACVAGPVSCPVGPAGDTSCCLMRGLGAGQRRGSSPGVRPSGSAASAVVSAPVCSSRSAAAAERSALGWGWCASGEGGAGWLGSRRSGADGHDAGWHARQRSAGRSSCRSSAACRCRSRGYPDPGVYASRRSLAWSPGPGALP